ncbi:DUF1642 domain-containing protein [Lactococcus lactis]|nr:DUF1642 domain-containing protein [Lactococcus lactis]
MTKFEEELMATAKMIPTSDGNEIKFKTSSALYDYLLLSNGEAELYLQQQALPVVPECVAVGIESLPDDYSAFEAISLINAKIDALPEENKDWLPVFNWLCDDIKNQDIFALAFITGKYQVEKPQLFYLKNMLTTSYLALDINTGYYEHWGEEIIPKLLKKQGYKLSFTKQEIDSMETGSYELVPVEDGE